MSLPPPQLGSRALWPTLRARAYLNHAGIAPLSEPVLRAVRAYLDAYAAEGFGALAPYMAQRADLRARLARLLGAAPEDVALRPNTTQGVTDIAWAFPWRAGDRVVLFRSEFPANITPWQEAARHFGAELAWLDADAFRTEPERAREAFEAELRRGARLVAVSAVQFQTGFRMPLAWLGERCRAHGAELFVDAVQAAGMVPLDVRALGVDYLASGGHKWMLSPEGTGFLYVSPARVGALVPRLAGWLSHEDPVRFLTEGEGHLRYDRPFRARADVFEGGNVHAAGLAGMHASVGLLLELGVETIFAHAQRYLDALEPGLRELGYESLRAPTEEGRSGALCVRVPGAGSADTRWSRAFAERGVVCATPDGKLRFAPHWANSVEEVPHVLEAARAVRDALAVRA